MIVRIRELVQKGQGLGRGEDNKVVFVSGALPGELVDVSVTSSKKDYLMGCAREILEPSEERVAAPCPYYGICGGCNLMHLAPEAQRRYKKKIFLDTLHKFKILDPDSVFQIQDTVSGDDLGYRTRVRFDVKGNAAGFCRAQSKEFVQICHCPAIDPRIDALLQNGNALVMASDKGQCPVCISDQGPLLGKAKGTVSVLGRILPVTNGVFFQSNLGLLPSMIEYVVSQVKGENVMDLYSGIGTFSAFLEDEHKVVAVERDPGCLALAHSHLKKTAFFTRSVEDFKFSGGTDTVVVDPPRVGLDRKVPKQLAKLDPSRIVYVSCDSVTFARDAAAFKNEGYELVSSRIFDFYPQTSHMESVNVLERRTGR